MKYKSAIPVISTDDVLSTVRYYQDVLGFRQHFIFGDPPVYAGIERDGVLIYVTLDVALTATLKQSDLHPDLFLWVEDIDKAYAEHKQRGAKIFEEIADRPWDARQYVVEDPNGYRLKVGQPLDDE